MDRLTTRDVNELLHDVSRRCVSLYMPVHQAGKEMLQNPIRLKNLLTQAEDILIARGMRSPEARELVAPARKLIENEAFWREQGKGLAMFLSPLRFRMYRSAAPFEEFLAVERRFCVRQLLPLVSRGERFYVLGISESGARLLRGWRDACEELDVPALQASMAEVLNYDVPQESAQAHTAMRGPLGKQAAVFHGQGGAPDAEKDERERYFRHIDAEVRRQLRDEQALLVLAGVEANLALYRKVNGYPHLADAEIRGNPDLVSPAEMHERAWPLVEAVFDRPRVSALAKYAQLAGTGKTADDLRQILPAAAEGRIETLFVDPLASRRGEFKLRTHNVEFHTAETPGDDDLVDLTVELVLKSGGSVYAGTNGGTNGGKYQVTPAGEPAAALLRF